MVTEREIKRIAEELKEFGIEEQHVALKKVDPNNDPNIVAPIEAMKIRSKLSSIVRYNRLENAKRFIGDRKITSGSVLIMITVFETYEDDFALWTLDRLYDPDIFLETIKNGLKYSHHFDIIKNHFNILKSAGVIVTPPKQTSHLDAFHQPVNLPSFAVGLGTGIFSMLLLVLMGLL